MDVTTEPIPTKDTRPNLHTVTAFRLPVNLLLMVDLYCVRNDVNRSQFFRIALRERLKSLGFNPEEPFVEERNVIMVSDELDLNSFDWQPS
jgi:hypothetical protein